MADQNYNKAYEAYQQAVYRDGKNPTFWCSIGVLYYQINQYRDALDAYSRAIRLNPYISEVWFDLGSLYESCNNQIADAIDAYARAAELDPDNPHIQQRLQVCRNAEAKGENPPGAPMPQDIHPTAYSQDSGMAPGPPSQIGGHAGMSSHPGDRGGPDEHSSHPSHRSSGPQLPAADRDREGVRADLPGPGSLPHAQSRGPTPPLNERGDHSLSQYRGGGGTGGAPGMHMPFDDRERERGAFAHREPRRMSPGGYSRGGGGRSSNSRRNSPARSVGNGSDRGSQYGGRDNMDWESQRSRGGPGGARGGRISPEHHAENGHRGPLPPGGSSSRRGSPPAGGPYPSSHRRSDGSVQSNSSNTGRDDASNDSRSEASKFKKQRNSKSSKDSYDAHGNGNGNFVFPSSRNRGVKSPTSSYRDVPAQQLPPRRAVDEDYDDGDSAADALMGLAGAASAEADAARKSKSNSEEREKEAQDQAQKELQEGERNQEQQRSQQQDQKKAAERQNAEQTSQVELGKQQQEQPPQQDQMEVDPPAAPAPTSDPTSEQSKPSPPSESSSVLGKRQASEGAEGQREAESKRARNGVEDSTTVAPAASASASASTSDAAADVAMETDASIQKDVPASAQTTTATEPAAPAAEVNESTEETNVISTKATIPEGVSVATTAGQNQKEVTEAAEGDKAKEAENVSVEA